MLGFTVAASLLAVITVIVVSFISFRVPLSGKDSLKLDEDLKINIELQGTVRGHKKIVTGGSFYAYEGIPYAATPVRFQVPYQHEGWNHILEANRDNIACMQDTQWNIKIKPSIILSEDCLLLNVYVPKLPAAVKEALPVLFWIHGGGFINEYGALYDPRFFMNFDIIVVTFNYRLGPFGFLTTEDGVIPANIGLKDQQFALKWVQKHIHSFGGNASQITIAGARAGASSVSFQMLNKENEGAFRAAILQSGTAMNIWAFTKNAKQKAFELTRMLYPTFNSSESEDVMRLLRKANAEDLDSYATIMRNRSTEAPWLPSLEDASLNGAFLTEPMHEAFIKGHFRKVPILTGFTSEESLFLLKDPEFVKQQAKAVDSNPELLFDDKLNVPEIKRKAAGLELKALFTNTSFENDLGSYVKALSSKVLTTGILRQAELFIKHRLPVFLYEFSYKGFAHEMIGNNFSIPGAESVGHAEDIFYTWDFGPSLSMMDEIMNHRYSKYITNFVMYLNPIVKAEKILGNISWPVADIKFLTYLNINETVEVRVHPKNYERIRPIYEKYLRPPLVGF